MRHPERFVAPIVMATLMSFVMSGLITTINLGLSPNFLSDWMGSWSISGPIAIAGVLLMRPVADRIAALITLRLFPRHG
ncbi:MAG: DUF2798 domain-containing protein [Pseudomonadota bacterium]